MEHHLHSSSFPLKTIYFCFEVLRSSVSWESPAA